MDRNDAAGTAAELNAVIAALVQASGHDAREPLRDRLRRIGGGDARTLAGRLDHPDAFVRWELVNLLGELADARTAQAVLEFALAEDEIHARWRAFWAVTRFDPAFVLPRLLVELDDDGGRRQWRAALLLSMMGRGEAVPVLLQGLESGDEWIQWEALAALRALRPAGCEARLAAFLDARRPRALRTEAVLALGAIGSPTARTLVRAMLADPDPQVRWRASLALSGSGRRRDLDLLRAARLCESDDTVKEQLERDIADLEARHATGEEAAAEHSDHHEG